MRPPEFTGGNPSGPVGMLSFKNCFNEAAGIHRRKLGAGVRLRDPRAAASMRPPEFTGGNLAPASGCATRGPPLQ